MLGARAGRITVLRSRGAPGGGARWRGEWHPTSVRRAYVDKISSLIVIGRRLVIEWKKK